MRIVIRTYRDEFTKPHYDEFKVDCDDESTLTLVGDDAVEFISNAFWELKEEEEEEL